MKKIVVLFLVLSLSSCNSQEKKATTFEDVTVEQFQNMIGKNGAQLIDVRTPREYENGLIKDRNIC